jgi:hypothetical protein
VTINAVYAVKQQHGTQDAEQPLGGIAVKDRLTSHQCVGEALELVTHDTIARRRLRGLDVGPAVNSIERSVVLPRVTGHRS